MKRNRWWMLTILAAVVVAVAIPDTSHAQQKKLVLWTHWDQNPEFNKWYAEKGKEFAKKSGYEVEVVTIPYQGYEAKYLAAFMAKSSAPDIFMGMTHQWCGQYDFCDRMPADLAKIYEENLPKYMLDVGKWKGVRYGIPIEHGNFQQMYINVDMFKKAGLNPDDPPKTFDKWLADLKKLTIPDAKGGDPLQVGFAIRSKGAPVGITDKFLPFAHAWGARMLSPELDKAYRLCQQPADGGRADVLRRPGAEGQGGEPVVRESRGRVRPEAGRRHLPRVLVLRLAQEERARRELQGVRAALREGLPRRGRAVPMDGPRLQEQPEQAGGLGVHAVHQQCQGRHGASPDAGDTSGLDGEPRYTPT